MLKRFTKLFLLGPALVLTGLSQSLHADWRLNFGGISAANPQDVVISLGSDPNLDPEAACVAVTLARSFSLARLPSGDPKANVTLFVTLDGVNLASNEYISKRRLKEYECATPFDPPYVTLKENLMAFISGNHNNLVVCPRCWEERYGDELPDYGVLPGKEEGVPLQAIGKMIFNADKILDF